MNYIHSNSIISPQYHLLHFSSEHYSTKIFPYEETNTPRHLAIPKPNPRENTTAQENRRGENRRGKENRPEQNRTKQNKTKQNREQNRKRQNTTPQVSLRVDISYNIHPTLVRVTPYLVLRISTG
jgi:hypothetical protein